MHTNICYPLYRTNANEGDKVELSVYATSTHMFGFCTCFLTESDTSSHAFSNYIKTRRDTPTGPHEMEGQSTQSVIGYALTLR